MIELDESEIANLPEELLNQVKSPVDLKEALPESSENTSEVTSKANSSEPSKAKEPERSEAELKAMKRGWVPKDQFDENSGKEYKSAEEFLAAEPYIDEIRKLKKTMHKFREQMSEIEKKNYAKVKAELEAKFEDAVARSNIREAKEVQKEIQELKTPENTEPQLHESVQVFLDENKWFQNPTSTEDHEMIALANAVDQAYIKENPGDIEGSIEAVRHRLKAVYGHRFQSKAEKNIAKEKSAPVTTTPKKVSNVSSPDGINLEDFSKDTIEFARDLVKKGIFKSEKDYLSQVKELASRGQY